MGISWVIEGRFLQAISLLLVITLIIVLFVWLLRIAQPHPQEAEEQTDATGHKKYSDDDFTGLD